MSSQDTEQYRLFIRKLQREEHRQEALNDIKNLLAYKPAGEAFITIRDGGISKIVQCLNVSDKAHVTLTCEVLKVCFEKLSAGIAIQNYTSHIMYLLRHEKDCVRRLAVDEVHKAITTDIKLLPVPQYIDVFVAVAQLVSDNDVGVANQAVLITSNLPLKAYRQVLEELKNALEYNSSSKCNAFEVIINISIKSYDLFNLCIDYGFIHLMFSELKSDDVLYQLNILELLSRLAVKPHAISYFVQHGVLKNIPEIVADLKNNPLGGLLIPGYIKFLGCIGHHYPNEMFEIYPTLLSFLFDAVNSSDQNILPVALDTLGYIGVTIEGKLSLAAIGAVYIQIVEKLGQLMKSSPMEIKVRALYCFANLISIDKDTAVSRKGPVDHRVTLMTREWFRSFSLKPDSMQSLFEICKNPFPDIRLAAFNFLDAVCQHQWGEVLVAREAGLIEYLLDRSVVHTKELKEAKYDIIKRLSTSAAFDANIIARLQTYVEQGPFYTEAILDVAVEEE